MPPTVSVIVPVYNAAQWLPRCLDSLCSQTLENIEIICVDDGSQDDSPAILEAYSSRDARIRLIRLGKNSGVSIARNTGIKAASGDWLGFVDSDDFVLRTFYENLYSASSLDTVDIIKGEIWGYDNDKQRVEPREFYAINSEISKNNAYFCFGFTSAIFRRKFIEENSIFFPTDLVTLEDPCFTIMAAIKARPIRLINSAYYFYAQNHQSVTQNPGPLSLRTASVRKACELVTTFLDKENADLSSCHIIITFLSKQLRGQLFAPETTKEDKLGCMATLFRMSLHRSMRVLESKQQVLETHCTIGTADQIRLSIRAKAIDNILRQQLRQNI